MHFEGRRACSQHLDPRELPGNDGFRMFSLAWKPGVHQGKTHPNGGNDGFPQGKHQGFAWWRVRESLGPALPFPASAGPGRTSPGFHQRKVRIPPGFPQGKSSRLSKLTFPSFSPGFHQVKTRSCEPTQFPPGKHLVFSRGKVGVWVPLENTRFSPGESLVKPQGLPRGKAAYAGKPQKVPRGNPWGKPGFPSPTGRVLRLDFPKETPGFSLPPATFPAPFWARLRFPRGFLGEKQDNWSSPGETLEHRLSPGAPFWVRLRFPRGFPGDTTGKLVFTW